MKLETDANKLYAGLEVPELVDKAIALARENDFTHSCAPAQGRLLQILAAGRAGGVIGETGTGYGTGLAWMISGVGSETRFFSIEIDANRAAASQELFKNYPNVTVIHGHWSEITAYAPFDLLILDGGGGGKNPNEKPADPSALLVPGGTVVLDDFHPPAKSWPPRQQGKIDQWGRDLDAARTYWFAHPDLLTTEVRVHPQVSTIIGMRCGKTTA